MKTNVLIVILLVVMTSCKDKSPPPQPPPTSTTAVPNTLTDAEKSAGWRLLFDGQSTTGWRNYGKQTMSAGWKVEDGTLTRTGAGGDIITTDEFGNFDLTLEWKIEPGGNSGIFYRAAEDKDEIYWNAPEVQVLDDANHPDGRTPLQSAGALYDLYQVPAGIVKPANEWNTVRLLATGPHVEHWLNGVKVVEYEIGSRDWDARIARSKFAPYKKFGRSAQGHIGLQDHGNIVAFRNIKIRVLP
jgi:hypothetical protein